LILEHGRRNERINSETCYKRSSRRRYKIIVFSGWISFVKNAHILSNICEKSRGWHRINPSVEESGCILCPQISTIPQ